MSKSNEYELWTDMFLSEVLKEELAAKKASVYGTANGFTDNGQAENNDSGKAMTENNAESNAENNVENNNNIENNVENNTENITLNVSGERPLGSTGENAEAKEEAVQEEGLAGENSETASALEVADGIKENGQTDESATGESQSAADEQTGADGEKPQTENNSEAEVLAEKKEKKKLGKLFGKKKKEENKEADKPEEISDSGENSQAAGIYAVTPALEAFEKAPTEEAEASEDTKAVPEEKNGEETEANTEKTSEKSSEKGVWAFKWWIWLLVIFAALMMGAAISAIIFTVTFTPKVNQSNLSGCVDLSDDTLNNSEVSKLQQVYNFIRNNYYTAYDSDELVEGAISGMVEALGDPYSTYYGPQQMDAYTDYVEGTTGGYDEKSTVSYEKLENNVAYIKIDQFIEGTAEDFKTNVDQAANDGCTSMIIDLRDNPGGYAAEAAAVADVILGEGTVAYCKDREGATVKTYTSDKNEISVPCVLLVNGNTASSSELIAGAFKDFEKGEIIGAKTYGKSLAQIYLPFENDGSGVVLSTFTYYTPSGDCINGKGVTPTIVVPEGEDALEAALEALNVR